MGSSFRFCSGVSLAIHMGVASFLVARPVQRPPVRPAKSTPTLAGDSFEVAAQDESVVTPATPPQAEGTASMQSRKHNPRSSRSPGAEKGATDSSRTEDPPRLFGAEGDRAAVDLATAFTRQFPQAASTDPVWI